MKALLKSVGLRRALLLAAVFSLPGCLWAAGELDTPFRIEAKGKLIDMEDGCAAPYTMDFDGDGKFDLLVGQRGECKLRIYRNEGSSAKPQFGASAWFKAGGAVATLPGG